MTFFSKDKMEYEDFIELVKKLTDDQYGQDMTYSDYSDVLDEFEEANDPAADKRKKIIESSVADLTKIKSREEIKDKIHALGNIIVGNFLIKISRYSAVSTIDGEPLLDISIMEKINKIHQKVFISKDARFREAPWKQYFPGGSKQWQDGKNIPIKEVVEIVRWLQLVNSCDLFF